MVQRVIFKVLPTNYYLTIANNSCYILLKRHKQGVGSFQKLRYHLGWEILEIRQFFYNDIFHHIGSLEEWNKVKLNNSYVIYE